jgi:hypothetical protein
MIVGLKKADLKIGPVRSVSEKNSAVLYIQDPVGRSALHRRENAARSTGIRRAAGQVGDGLQVVPVRQDRVVLSSSRQAAIGNSVAIGGEAQRAIGPNDGRGEALIIEMSGERQGDRRCAIVGVIAGIARARNDRS